MNLNIEKHNAIIQHAKELLPSIIIQHGKHRIGPAAIDDIIVLAITIANTFDTISNEFFGDPEQAIENCASMVSCGFQ
jgi:hypothetical protein